MEKIISLYQRNYDGDRLVRDEVVPGAEWVLAGEGVATRKFDGTCVKIDGGRLFKRYDARTGKPVPPDFEPAEPAPNEHTGHWPGWLPVGDGPEDRWYREALQDAVVQDHAVPADRTYELIGPKVQGNPEHADKHVLVRHGADVLLDAPRDFLGLRDYFLTHDIEGLVWHHPDGRMVKIKGKDFGVARDKPGRERDGGTRDTSDSRP